MAALTAVLPRQGTGCFSPLGKTFNQGQAFGLLSPRKIFYPPTHVPPQAWRSQIPIPVEKSKSFELIEKVPTRNVQIQQDNFDYNRLNFKFDFVSSAQKAKEKISNFLCGVLSSGLGLGAAAFSTVFLGVSATVAFPVGIAAAALLIGWNIYENIKGRPEEPDLINPALSNAWDKIDSIAYETGAKKEVMAARLLNQVCNDHPSVISMLNIVELKNSSVRDLVMSAFSTLYEIDNENRLKPEIASAIWPDKAGGEKFDIIKNINAQLYSNVHAVEAILKRTEGKLYARKTSVFTHFLKWEDCKVNWQEMAKVLDFMPFGNVSKVLGCMKMEELVELFKFYKLHKEDVAELKKFLSFPVIAEILAAYQCNGRRLGGK